MPPKRSRLLNFSDETVFVVVLISVLAVSYVSLKEDPLAKPLITSNSVFSGNVSRAPEGHLIIAGAKGVSVAWIRLPIRPHSTYLVKLRLAEGPALNLDLYGADYDLEDKIIGPRAQGGNYKIFIDSGPPSSDVTFRLMNYNPSPITIFSLSLTEVGRPFIFVRRLLQILSLLVAAGYALRHIGLRWVQGAIVFFIVLVIYALVSHFEFSVDNAFYVPTSLSLLSEGNIELSEYQTYFRPDDNRIISANGGVYSLFPIGTSLVVLPLVPLGQLLNNDVGGLTQIAATAAFCAKVLAALSVALFFLVARQLASVRLALTATIAFALGTTHFSSNAVGLWSHNAGVFVVLVALWLLIRDENQVWVSGLPAGVAFLVRPDLAPMSLAIAAYILIRQRKQFPRFAAIAGGIIASFSIASYSVYGHFLPPYYLAKGHFGPSLSALVGSLLSPNRGLLPFSPVLIFAFYGVWLALRQRASHPLYVYLAPVVLIHWILLSVIWDWYAGHSFGPRLFTPVLPALCLLLIPALERISRSRVLVFGFGFLLIVSVGVHLRGATSIKTRQWNVQPNKIDEHLERLWDWRDWQPLRGI